ncbi:MAG: FAD-dependent oxidoreductase [Chloroflexi bacterium]|nr:FAD-dependent oxidoreductase [Chloroflexota bacterium]
MSSVILTINGAKVEGSAGETIIAAARKAGIYIPALCAHPDLPPAVGTEAQSVVFRGRDSLTNSGSQKQFEGCQLCLVEIEGKQEPCLACNTPIAAGMVIQTDTPAVQQLRRRNLAKILATHPHLCLLCPQNEGCSLTSCSSNAPEKERCCSKFNNCEIRKVARYIGIPGDTPRYNFEALPLITDEPLFSFNYNLCIGCLRCVKACRELRGVKALGFVFDEKGRVRFGTMAPSLEESGCKFCGACVAVCPTGALLDKGTVGAEREKLLVPCRQACPAGMDVARYVSLISQEKLAEAIAVIREKAPFPQVLGYVCTHLCEAKCRRGEVNEAIAIRALKRYVAEEDKGLWKSKAKFAPSTGKKVAVIGSGPAGLTAAYYLAKQGHSVTVFESLPLPGGMMRIGIPEYRLPKRVLDAEISLIQEAGVDIKVNTLVTSPDSLFEQGYQAVFMAVGAHQNVKMNIPGEDSPGVIDCVSLLRRINLGEAVTLSGKVGVVGGGNAAIDAARSALRLGAEEVSLIYRRSQSEMPVTREELEAALEEGVKLIFLTTPIGVAKEDGVLRVECIRLELGEVDASGRPRPVPIKGSEFTMPFNHLIIAVGQVPQTLPGFGVNVGQGSRIQVNPTTLATNKQGIFAGGDAVSGPASVIEAIADGRRAAISIDKYLGGDGIIDETLTEAASPDPWLGRTEGFANQARVLVPHLPAQERCESFATAELGFSRALAVKEATRCLQCHLRLQVSAPPLPPEEWLKFEASQVSLVPATAGVVQLLDEGKETLYIKGAENMRGELEEKLKTNEKARYFIYEEKQMYTIRESELLQQFLQKYHREPELNASDLGDLF